MRIPSTLLLRLTLRPLLLHPLATRSLTSQLFHFAEAVTVGVALLARGFHGVDAVLLVVGCGGFPGFGAGGGADGGLWTGMVKKVSFLIWK